MPGSGPCLPRPLAGAPTAAMGIRGSRGVEEAGAAGGGAGGRGVRGLEKVRSALCHSRLANQSNVLQCI